MGNELETRRNDKLFLYDLLEAQKENSLEKVISKLKAGMEQDDVKVVLQEFEEAHRNKTQ